MTLTLVNTTRRVSLPLGQGAFGVVWEATETSRRMRPTRAVNGVFALPVEQVFRTARARRERADREEQLQRQN